jgi:hypothetical protein
MNKSRGVLWLLSLSGVVAWTDGLWQNLVFALCCSNLRFVPRRKWLVLVIKRRHGAYQVVIVVAMLKVLIALATARASVSSGTPLVTKVPDPVGASMVRD